MRDMWELIASIAGAVVAVIAMIAVIYRKVAVPFIHLCKRMDERLEYIDGEMRNDGGPSMREAIDHIETRLTKLEPAKVVITAKEASVSVEPQ